MPTTPFLIRDGVSTYARDVHNPSLLSQLRADAEINRFVGEGGPSNQVRTKLFLSKSESTLYSIKVGQAQGNSIYADGKPTGTTWSKLGDGTVVRYLPTNVGLGAVSLEDSQSGEHTSLNFTYRDQICDFLTGGGCSSVAGDEIQRGTAARTSALFVAISGRVQPYLLDGNGRGSGIHPGTGDLEENIPASSVSAGTDGASILVEDATNGAYEVQLTALPEELFDVTIGYAGTVVEERRLRGIYHGGSVSVHFAMDAGATPVVSVHPAVGAPSGVRSERTGGATRLVWTASTDGDVVGYNVYGRPDSQPKFTLLGTTTGTTFDTGYAWVSQGNGILWQYFVLSVAADGTESFFDEVVENRNPLVARFSSGVTYAFGEPHL